MVNGRSSGKQIISQFAFNVFRLINAPIQDLVEERRSDRERESDWKEERP